MATRTNWNHQPQFVRHRTLHFRQRIQRGRQSGWPARSPQIEIGKDFRSLRSHLYRQQAYDQQTRMQGDRINIHAGITSQWWRTVSTDQTVAETDMRLVSPFQ